MTKLEFNVTNQAGRMTYNQNPEAYLSHARHELRTPLNILMGYSDLLMEDAEERDHQDFQTQLQQINIQARGVLRVVNTSLDVSRNPAEFGPVYVELSEQANSIQTFVLHLLEEARHHSYTFYLKDLGRLQVSTALLVQYVNDFLAPEQFRSF